MSEVWLSGPIEGIDPVLQPVAFALMQAQEDIQAVCGQLHPSHLWAEPAAATAPIGYHVKHLAGATDRLFTYARGEQLSEAQKAQLEKEKQQNDPSDVATLVDNLKKAIGNAIQQLRNTPADILQQPRELGRKKLPTTVIGLLFHAAEHAARHAGQITTTAKVLQSLP